MEVSKQIKKYRLKMQWSQEELADKIYVSRQTISNWETEKNYPDVHSLILLSNLFGISLDALVKGDLKQMKEQISQLEVKKFHREGIVFTILLISMTVSLVPLLVFMGKIIGSILWLLIAAVTLYDAFRIEKYKKLYNIQTYQEIIAFMEGKCLDEIEQISEQAKRPYQKILLMLCSMAVSIIVTFIMLMLFKIF